MRDLFLSHAIMISSRIADELFKEVLEEVATELEQICDGYVDSLYSAEFVRPADVHT